MAPAPKFLCYEVYDGKPDNEKPIDYCITDLNRIWISVDLEDAKSQVLYDWPDAIFIDNCGWLLSGEEEKLLDRQFEEIFLFELMSREAKKSKELR